MSKNQKIVLILGDIIALYLSLIITLIIRYGYADLKVSFASHFEPLSLIFILWLVVFYIADLYKIKTFRFKPLLLKNIISAVIISGALSVVIFYLFGDFFRLTPKTNLLVLSALVLVFIYFWRKTAMAIFKAGALKIIVAGDSLTIRETIVFIENNPQLGYQIVEWFRTISPSNFKTINQIIREEKIDIVVIHSDILKDTDKNKLIYQLLPLEIKILDSLNFYEIIFEKISLEEVNENWFVENISFRRPFYDAFKRIIDIVLAGIWGVLFLPLMALIALLLKINSPGPVIYTQERIGKNNIPFTLYKFRTMTHQNKGLAWTLKNDNRITKIGKILRFSHLDELPQLFNIIKGDLSFTGPRAERTELVKKYQKFPYYELRHIIKPGLSGWAQINYRPSASLDEAFEKLKYDIYYIKNRSLFLDILIVIKTIRHFFISYG